MRYTINDKVTIVPTKNSVVQSLSIHIGRFLKL